MPRRDLVKTVARKAPIVMNSAIILNKQYEDKELTSDEAYLQMIKFANIGNFKSYWFDIDELLREKYETEKWFWLVRRLRNTINEW